MNHNKNMEEQKTNGKKEKKRRGDIFIPAGLFLGFGIGFALNNVPAGILVGFGGGFAAFAISRFFEK